MIFISDIAKRTTSLSHDNEQLQTWLYAYGFPLQSLAKIFKKLLKKDTYKDSFCLKGNASILNITKDIQKC